MAKVIAAIDNSAAARPVIATARAIGHVLGASVEGLHVRENGASTAHGEADAAGIPLRVIQAVNPARQIISAAEDRDVAAVVVGARGTPGGARPCGHVAMRVIKEVDKPTVVVPPETAPNDKLHSVLVPMMGQPTTAASVRNTISLVNASHVGVTVLHVYDEASLPAFSDQPQYQTQEWAQEFLARYVPVPADAVRLELRVGVPVEQIMRVCDETSPDAIAMGWIQDVSPGRGLLVQAVLARSRIPVILLPVSPRVRQTA
ncbi:MAG TPA: universal stress protein [Actinomycetota bacterium]|nr:universal stress protein [Actinomycetota bacterium]